MLTKFLSLGLTSLLGLGLAAAFPPGAQPPDDGPPPPPSAKKKGEPGIDGGMMKRKNPGQPFTNYITVKSIEAMNQAVEANGGTIVLPRQEIGQGMGWISAFKDPENNIIGLHQVAAAPPKRNAKQAAKKTSKRKRR